MESGRESGGEEGRGERGGEGDRAKESQRITYH